MLPLTVLLASVVLFRLAPWMAGSDALKAVAGFSPLCALALCGGAFVPRKGHAYLLAAAAVLVSQALINLKSGWPVADWRVLSVLAVVGAITFAGIRAGNRAPLAAFLGLSVAGTLAYHLVTNTVSFFSDPGYAKTLAGWWQCQTTGLPGYPPTWTFTARQLAGDLLFTAAFVCAFRRRPVAESPAAAPARA